MVNAVMHNLAVEVAAELRDVFVVCVQNGGRAGVKLLDELVLRACDVGDGRKKLQMDRSNVRNYPDVRMSDLSERGNLTRVRHPEFDDRDLVLGFELKQLQWQSEMVVEVPFRFHHAKTRRENVSDGFLRSRFAR